MGNYNKIRFACDDMVGRLARWLRILGYDTSYDVSLSEGEFIRRAVRESRLVLTRDHGLKERWTLPSCLRLTSDSTYEQLRQVISELQLPIADDKIFTVCLKCNELLEKIEKSKVRGKVPAYVYRTQARFVGCPRCHRIYWEGTHHRLVRNVIDSVLEKER